MKRKLFTLLSIVAILICALSFCACDQKPNDSPTEKTIHIIVADKDLTVNTTKTTIGAVMNVLKDEKKLTFEVQGSDYGNYLLSIEGLVPPDFNHFVRMLSTSTDMKYSMPVPPIVINGKNYYPANYGIDSMPILDGITYLFDIGEVTF